jgi:hypothetical protein
MDTAGHAMGVELELEELVERRRRAVVQGRLDDAAAMDIGIRALQDELAALAESCADLGGVDVDGPE